MLGGGFNLSLDQPCVRLVAIPHHEKQHAPEEPVDPDPFPPFVLVLLAGRHAPEPAAGRVVRRSFVAAASDALRTREGSESCRRRRRRGEESGLEVWSRVGD